MSHPVYIVDTGYLLALLDVPGETQVVGSARATSHGRRNVAKEVSEVQEVRQRFEQARRHGHDCIVPMAVLYEVASHINDVSPRNVAQSLARELANLVKSAVAEEAACLFRIEPRPTLDEIERLMMLFASAHVTQNHSLTDTAVIDIARQERANRDDRYRVHIWTWERRHAGIRAYSPDAEPAPFPAWID